MRVKLITLMCGPEGVQHPGSVADLPAHFARALVSGGFAVSLDPEDVAEIETAELPALASVEVADTPKRGRKKGI